MPNCGIFPGHKVQILGREDWPANTPLGPTYGGMFWPVDTVDSMLETYGDGLTYTVKRVRTNQNVLRAGNPIIQAQLNNEKWYIVEVLKSIDNSNIVPFTVGDCFYEQDTCEVYCVTSSDCNKVTGNSVQSDSWIQRYHEDVELFEGDIDSLPKLFTCRRCGSRYNLGNDTDVFPEDRELCPTCRERRFVASYHSFKPHLLFYGKNGKEDYKYESLYLGAEIEMAGGGESNANAAEIMDKWNALGYKNFVYITHDGSLRSTGDEVDGFEMVTKPATLEFHRKIADEYKNIFKLSTAMGYRAHDTSCCGLHVHINRGFFGSREETAILNMLYLFDKYWNEIQIFSRRDSASLSRYARRISLDWEDEDYFEHFNLNDEDHDGHYYSINITNPGTIEIRVFKGTLNFNTYLITLEFVANLAKVCKESRRIENVAFEDLLSPEGLEYYKNRMVSQKYEAESYEN